MAVAKFLSFLQANYDISILGTSPGCYSGTLRSARVFTEDDLSECLGSIQWICRSPYRPDHKRKNWYIDFSACAIVEIEKFDPKQIVFDTFRSGGKGRQNVNKVESGVRLIYLPTGQAVVCTEERSQYANNREAVARLQEMIKQANQREQAKEENNNWRCHTSLERGNSCVIFYNAGFQ